MDARAIFGARRKYRRLTSCIVSINGSYKVGGGGGWNQRIVGICVLGYLYVVITILFNYRVLYLGSRILPMHTPNRRVCKC